MSIQFTPEQMRLHKEFTKKLNSSPTKKYTKFHQYDKCWYVPIEAQEEIANEVFGYWHFEVTDTVLSQAITSKGEVSTVCAITGILHYWHPILERMMTAAGAGSASVAGKQGITTLAPKAKTNALKNAFNTWKLLGGGLNRKAEDKFHGTMEGLGDRLISSLSEIEDA